MERGAGAGRVTGAGLVGRQEELAALAGDGPGGVLVVVVGERGSGRTALADGAAAAAAAAGRPVLRPALGAARTDADEYGAGPLLDAVGAQYESLGSGPELMRLMARLRRSRTAAERPAPDRRAGVRGDVKRLLAHLGRRPVLVVLDDADLLPNPEPLAVAARAAGHRVVATTGLNPSLAGVADVVVRAQPLADDDVELLLRRSLRARPDPTLVATVARALGPLAGNPGHLLALVERLRDADRLVTVARRVCLRDPERTPALPPGAPAVVAAGEPGGPAEDLVLLVDGPARVRVDDLPHLAAALRRTVADTGRAFDRLVDAGVLAEAEGVLRVRSPAVGAALRERAGDDHVRSLHAAVAVAAAGDTPAGGLAPLDPHVLADHVVAAGEQLPPDPAWADLLIGEIELQEHRDVRRADRFLRPAFRHGYAGALAPGTVGRVLAVMLRAGDHRGVLDYAAACVDPPGRAPRDLLAAASAVAALSLGVPVPPAVGAALGRDDDPSCPLALVRRWEAGRGVAVDELLSALAVLVPPEGTLPTPSDVAAIEALLAVRNSVGALERLLGPTYAGPAGSPLVQTHRVVAAYRSGRWNEATSGARAVVARHRDTDLGQLAALLASDIAFWQGDERAAGSWAEYLPGETAGGRHPVLRANLLAARLWVGGDAEAAIEQGWLTWQTVGPATFTRGRRALLTRLCGIAAADSRTGWYPRLLTAAEGWRDAAHGADAVDAAETVALVRGVLGGGATSRAILRRTTSATRRRGHRAELAWVLLAAGAAQDHDPAPAWYEAYAIAGELRAPVMLAQLRRLMDARGVRLPLGRSRDTTELTEVQLRIVELVERGMTNRQIARAVGLSEKTVENHLTRLFERYGCRTRHGLATARAAERRDEVAVGA